MAAAKIHEDPIRLSEDGSALYIPQELVASNIPPVGSVKTRVWKEYDAGIRLQFHPDPSRANNEQKWKKADNKGEKGTVRVSIGAERQHFETPEGGEELSPFDVMRVSENILIISFKRYNAEGLKSVFDS